MGFGGKNRKATGRRPGIPHHPLARLRRWLERRTWGHVEVSINGVPMPELTEVTWDAEMKPTPHPSLISFDELVAATERAIEALFIDSTVMLGLDASMAPHRVFGVLPGAPPCCTAAVALPDTGGDLKALVCTLNKGHGDWHLDVTGARWSDNSGELLVQAVGFPSIITTEVRAKT